jgi:hypothetical protein
MKKQALLALIVLTAATAATAQTAATGQVKPEACDAIGKLSVPQTEITQAAVVAPGSLELNQGPMGDALMKKLPAFCRVVAVAHPSPDSNIKIEVWLPLSGWNGRFIGQGNGGFAGVIGYQGLAVAVLSGFASGGTDTGHTGGATDSSWALGHPEKIVDFGYRGVHVMTDFSKAVVKALYSAAPQKNYFSSCSDGGREALMEAQRFPADYDGILAGAPAYNWSSLLSRGTQLSARMGADPAKKLTAAKVPAINKAVLAACHKDEPADFLADPRTCHFSPDTLLCKGAETDACLTPAEAGTVKSLYADSLLKDGSLEYHGMLPGGELGSNGWPGWITGSGDAKSEGESYGQGYFRNLVYSNAKWDMKDFDLDRDLKAAQQNTGAAVDAVNPDLRPFLSRGGKLILYHGMNDPAISPLATVDYYNGVEKTVGEQATSSVRLFLVPGMQHCGGGPGPADFGQFGPSFKPALDNPANNITFALLAWVEQGSAPEQIIARGNTDATGAGGGVAFSQPICAYPKVAGYKGSGDRKDAASYACVAK